MPYHPTGIQQLSQPQIHKLLSGGRIRVKLGHAHKIHITHEHHKKLHRAHLKGAGVMLEIDPYAQELNAHLRGEGLMKHVKHAAHKVGQFVKDHKTQFRPLASALKEAGHQKIADASMFALEQGVDPSLVGAYGSMAHEAIHPQGGSLKSFVRSPGMRVVRKALRPIGQMALHDTLGLATQGLSQGMSQTSNGMSSGMGFYKAKKAPAKRGHKKKGAALFPAGSGFGMGFGGF